MRTVCLFHRFPGILAVGSCLSCFSLSPDSLKEGGKSTQKTSLESSQGRWGPITPPPPPCPTIAVSNEYLFEAYSLGT